MIIAMASFKLVTLHIPPGNLGVVIQEVVADGTCLVASKTDTASPLQVGDIILSFHGTSLVPRRQADWVNIIQTSPQKCTRTVVVRRRQVNSTVITRTGNPAATLAGRGGSSQRIRSLEDGAKFTESQKKLMRMKESREAGKRKKDEAACPSRDEVETLERERSVQAQQFEMKRQELGRIKTEQMSTEEDKIAHSLLPDATKKLDELSRNSAVMVRLLENAMTKIEALKNELGLKNESHQALESEMEELKYNLGCVKGMLEEERKIHHYLNDKLEKADEKAQLLEKEVMARNDSNAMIQEECENLRRGLPREASLENEAETTINLQKELSTAKETEVVLRRRILVLESEKHKLVRQRDDARRKAEKNGSMAKKLQDTVKEHLSAIDSLVGSLERQRANQAKDISDRDMQIASLKSQLSAFTIKKGSLF